MKKVLITGANGQLGESLQEKIKELKLYDFQFIFTDKEELDITCKEEVNSFFSSHQIDYCVNCSAYTAVDKAESEENLAYEINSVGVRNLAENCANQNSLFIHISTDYVFDGTKNSPYLETDDTNPINVYGKSKLEGEKLALEKNANTVIIRTAWVYSKKYGQNFYKTMLRLMNEKDEINVVSDQIGCPTQAEDLAEAILNVIFKEKKELGIFHFVGNQVMSWYDFARKIAEENGFKTKINPIPTSAYPTPAKRPMYSVLSTEKFKLFYLKKE